MNKNAVLIELSESDRTAFGKRPFADQSFPQRVFSSIWALESEVNNGGFRQYFESDEAESVAFVVQALEAIGALDTADICKRAIATVFPDGLPASSEEIQDAARDFSDDTLDDIDQDFLAYPNDLTALLFSFVVAHPDEFGSVPILTD